MPKVIIIGNGVPKQQIERIIAEHPELKNVEFVNQDFPIPNPIENLFFISKGLPLDADSFIKEKVSRTNIYSKKVVLKPLRSFSPTQKGNPKNRNNI